MVKWLKIFPFLVPFILASCNAEQQRVIEMKTEVVDGLQFGVPEGRKVETGADHILLLPEQALREVDESPFGPPRRSRSPAGSTPKGPIPPRTP